MSVTYSDNAASVTTVPIEVGHETIIVASAAQFPALVIGQWFYVFVEEEVVKVTATSGNVLTCEAFGSGHPVGAAVELRDCSLMYDDMQNADPYSVAGGRPGVGTLAEGEPYFNEKDRQFGLGNGVGDPSDMVAVRYHSDQALYAIDDMVVQWDSIWRATMVHSGAFNVSNWEIVGSKLPVGGDAGQVLVKNSGDDYDATWADGPRLYTVGASGATKVVDGSDGDVQTITITEDTTLSFTGFTSSVPAALTLVIQNSGFAVTWDAQVKWPGGNEADLSVTGRYRIMFMTENGGTTLDASGVLGVYT